MQTESQVSLASEANCHQEHIPIQIGDPCVASSTPNNAVPEQPAKKPTRQWAAWTRQEEESFFTALRQVGKNFEKITCRVQSKNKDQVRHYYYRLVRRMNKLLGPGLCLDAKNSKDTNAAMLRWWSLLEKYSCRASKLHLKPRRFKIFVEALEHQLLKDRKKNVRKRPSQGENSSPTSPSTVTNQSRASGHDARTVKLVLVDSQNIQKLGPGKGSFKRNTNVGVNRSNSKGESNTMKPARQRRKPGSSSAAYKKWEKAAIAGVSLVADAAEHLERTTTDKEAEHDQDSSVPGHKILDPVETNQPPLPVFSQNPLVESNIHSAGKLKLQLFPIDDSTRRALEMDKHNPHLELTLSTRKKISSVLEHLTRKWGNSSVASGELMLFPYGVQRENLMGYQRWTQASIVSAADVYAMIGSPQVFRLRYGWFSDAEVASLTWQAPVSSYIPSEHNVNVEGRNGCIAEEVQVSALSTSDQSKKLDDPCNNQPTLRKENHALQPPLTNFPSEISRFICAGPKDNLGDSPIPVRHASADRSETCNVAILRQLEDVDDQRLNNNTAALSAGEWADSLTNISVGDLLAEVPHDLDDNCVDHPVAESSQCLQQIPFSCDSFDAAIAAHISRHQNKMEVPSLASHPSSIWDAEETCDAFSFSKNHIPCADVPRLSSAVAAACKQITRSNSAGSGTLNKLLPQESPDLEEPMENSACEDLVDESPSDPHIMDTTEKDFNGLTDIYWPDSLGPLDLDVPSCKYHNEDLILGDSLGGLNRLIASSLDAFQNCSFFGLDKKESTSTVGARDTASSAFKIGSEG
ncbi:TSL-kinase interacting protein 1, putative isoform 1 [Theobroma cacao]|uniref:TSL-kinase interacting protein 1, putative isoform 1 n=1 Tax=Theobroma cacao TaxID=3641 RepID=A0A061EU00_THECC|nr:TSL-kinase interacting protein 1, putative isoform 1 [Theobroma cacao]